MEGLFEAYQVFGETLIIATISQTLIPVPATRALRVEVGTTGVARAVGK